MPKSSSLLRFSFALVMASLATVAGFGALLAGLWHVGPVSITYQWVTAVISVVAALFLGGLILAWISKQNRLFPFLFGALFGGFSFSYILGLDPLVLLITAGCALVAGTGGFVLHRYRGISEISSPQFPGSLHN